jgi:hypothetical protein
MRRAFRINPDSLHYIAIEKPFHAQIDSLIDEYSHQLNTADKQPDAAFMIAALNYLLHDNEAARKAIEQAIDQEHDDSRSARNLHRLVQPG